MSDYSRTELTDENVDQSQSKLQHFWKLFYDPHTKRFIGRSGKSWGQIFIFYIIYYTCLAGFFIGMLSVFMQGIITYTEPMRTGEQSLLRLAPGLGFRPIPDHRATLIHYARTDPESYMLYTQNIRAFLDTYQLINVKPGGGFAKCENGEKNSDDIWKVCKFDLSNLGPCGTPDYGYAEGTPCVIIKMNKIFGWVPDLENTTIANDILVQCTGQNPADVENYGSVSFYPNVTIGNDTYGYFSSAYFPYLGQNGYRPPLVGMQFNAPAKHILLMVKCVLVNLQKGFKEGNEVKFELLVD